MICFVCSTDVENGLKINNNHICNKSDCISDELSREFLLQSEKVAKWVGSSRKTTNIYITFKKF